MKCNVWKPCSDQCWQDKLLFSIWRFFEQSSFVNIYLLCCRPTIHNLILKICPKFQVISFHFLGWWAAWWALSKNCVKWKYFNSNLCWMWGKMYQSKVCVQEFWNFVSGLDIQVEKSECDRPVCQKISCRWRNMTSHIQVFSSNWYEPMD